MTEAPMRTRRRQQPDETRTLILDAADLLLRERPFRDISVDDVMRPTGYGRTVFYRHFAGLPELVLAVLARVLPQFAATNEAFVATSAQAGSIEHSRSVLRPFVAHWRAHGTLMKAVRDAAVYDRDVDALVRAAEDHQRALLLEAMRRRRAAGHLGDVDDEQLATALMSMTERYLLLAYGDPAGSVAEEVATDTLAYVWHAALSAG